MSDNSLTELDTALEGLEHLRISHDPLHDLFSPTTLAHDLMYVDKTYYGSRVLAHDPPNVLIDGQSWTKNIEKLHLPLRMHKMISSRPFNLVGSITRLDLQNIGLQSVPIQVITLTRLTFLDLSRNHLDTLPPAFRKLKQLRHLNISHNRLQRVPDVISTLRKLMYLDLSHNLFRGLPISLSSLFHLTWLDVSHTRIDAVPAEYLRLLQMTIRTDGCPRLQRKVSRFRHSIAHSPPSLVEICARKLFGECTDRSGNRQQQQQQQEHSPTYNSDRLPGHVIHYLSQKKPCSFCGGPYFDRPIIRYRITLQNDGHYIPVKYQLCAAHWTSEPDRILAFFSQPSFR
ncbi:hypothetical protein BX666DRAFT_2155300 [Dichotomocladium elegans]|nr:hypothetical protein BX666DRAFT_2155300 [Dichotomocladium elegans]